MPGRHQLAASRPPRLRWLAGVSGAALAAATLLAFFPASASASGDAVTATFSATGVNPDNCDTNLGGADAYLKPGQELDVKSNLIGATLLGIKVTLANFKGTLTIDGKSYDVTSTPTSIGSLAAGNHDWTFKAKVLQILTMKTVANYSGKIHVTSAKTACGIAIQVPSIGASASVTGLPPINVGVPGVTVTVASSLPKLPNATSLLPSLPGLGGGNSSDGRTPAGGGASSIANVGGQLPVPARVVPGGGGGNLIGGTGGDVLPGSPATGVAAGHAPMAGGTSTTSAAAPTLQQDSTGKRKAIDLAASKANSTGQFSVILAIVAILALSVVAATYARLYLLRRETS